jgi:hypothetical protein
MMWTALFLVLAYLAGWRTGDRLAARVGDWFHRTIWGPLGLGVVALVAALPLAAQATRDSVVCTQCVKADSAIRVDTVPVVRYDTSWTYVLRDSVIRVPVTPPPPPPPASGAIQPSDTAGFQLLAHVVPVRDDDPGDGPVPLGDSKGWVGQMGYDAGPHLAPFAAAIRWHYRDGCWGGTSPGHAWFEAGLASRNAHTIYTRGWYRVSATWVGHVVGTKLWLHGWGQNGNQQILYLRGSGQTAGGTLRLGWSWQGAGALPTSARVGGFGGVDSKNGNFSVYGGTFPRDRWVKVETLSHAAPVGTRGSWAKVWLDGQLVAHVDGFDAARVAETRLTAQKLSPVWGGGVSCTAPGGQDFWIADFTVTGR